MDMSYLKACNWKQFYDDVAIKALEPRDNNVDLQKFVGSDHSGNKLTWL